jgi:hypothetical protein
MIIETVKTDLLAIVNFVSQEVLFYDDVQSLFSLPCRSCIGQLETGFSVVICFSVIYDRRLVPLNITL